MRSRTLSGLIVILAALAGFQAVSLLRIGPNRPPDTRFDPNLTATPGALVSSPVYSASGALLPVSGIAGGKCVLAVVYSPTCSASTEAASEWTEAVRADSLYASVAAAWRIVFVSVGESASTVKAFPRDFPFDVFRVEKVGQLEAELGISGYPAHFVLDRQGRFVEGSVTAPVPPRIAFRRNCLIAWNGRSERSVGQRRWGGS